VLGVRQVARGFFIAPFAALGLVMLSHGAAASSSAWVGRPLGDALKALHSRDFSVIFSSELVSESMQVTVDPRASDPAGVALQLLAPYGLALKRVSAGLYAVVRMEPEVKGMRALAGATSTATAVPLEQIVVAASRYTLTSLDMGAFHIDSSVLEDEPKFADDALRVLARLPGVAGNGVSARLNIRGGDSDEVLVLFDGYPIRQPFHAPAFQSPVSSFDTTTIARLEMYTGGFPLRYGGRMSGVLDIDSIEANQEPQNSLSASNFQVGVRTAGSLSTARHLDGLINFRAGQLHGLVDRLATSARAPIYSDGNAKLRWQPSETTSVTAHVLWSRDGIAVQDVERGEFARLDATARYAWLHVNHILNDRWRADAWFGNSQLQTHRAGQIDNPEVVQGNVDDVRSADIWDLRWRLGGAISERQNLEIGGEWQTGDADYAYSSALSLTPEVAALYRRDAELSRDIQIAPYRRDFSFFAAHRLRLATRGALEWGVRAERAKGLGAESRTVWDPRAMLSWNLGDRTQLRASWGRFHQVDDVQELHVEDGAEAFPVPQSSDHSIIGIQHIDRWGINWRAETFRKIQHSPRARYENELNPLAILSELAPDRSLISPDRAELRGLELSAAFQGKVWTWHVAYTWSDAVDEIAGIDGLRSWDQTHAFSSAVSWRRGPWTAGAAFILHTGWPTTRVERNAAGELQLGAHNHLRWPNFSTFDLHAGYRLPLTRGELLFALDLSNVFDRRNRCCSELLAAPANGGTGIVAEPLSLLSITPTVSVRWNF
jgi:outer membrane cobalamin receptor